MHRWISQMRVRAVFDRLESMGDSPGRDLDLEPLLPRVSPRQLRWEMRRRKTARFASQRQGEVRSRRVERAADILALWGAKDIPLEDLRVALTEMR